MKKRIMRDDYSGYEVQYRHWWWPFWESYRGCNTHKTLEQARAYANANTFVEYVEKEKDS